MLLGIDHIEGPIDDDFLHVHTRCFQCNKTNYFQMLISTYKELISPDRPYIQDLLPDFTDEQREELISGTCPECWKKLFQETE